MKPSIDYTARTGSQVHFNRAFFLSQPLRPLHRTGAELSGVGQILELLREVPE